MIHRLIPFALVALTACSSAPVAGPVRSVPIASLSGQQTLEAYRASRGLPVLKRNAKLTAAARRHLNDMVRNGFFAHRGSDGTLVGKRVTAQGYPWCEVSENLAQNVATEAQAVSAWDKSPSHRAAMRRDDVTEYGLVSGPNGLWVLIVAQPC